MVGTPSVEQVSFTSANFSLAFPYIAASEEKEAVESSLVSEFAETCGHNLAGEVAFMESCSLDGGNYEKLSDLKTFQVRNPCCLTLILVYEILGNI